jgi:hypothetical protein
MNALATQLDEDFGFQAMGPIVRLEGPVFVVRTERGDLRCRRAVSCLVEPLLHDYVLMASQGKAAYVLAVLERESPDTTLICEGNVDVKLGAGRLRIAAAEGVDVVTPKQVQIGAAHFGVHATTAKLVAQDLVALGSRMVSEIAHTSLRGSVLDKAFDRVSERVKRSFRRVDEIDQLKTKQLDYLATETMSLRSENMVATAKELVKVDGEQIHFG